VPSQRPSRAKMLLSSTLGGGGGGSEPHKNWKHFSQNEIGSKLELYLFYASQILERHRRNLETIRNRYPVPRYDILKSF